MFLLGAFAWFWIVLGIVFLVSPEKFRSALQKKGYATFRNYLLLFILFTSLLLINIAFEIRSIFVKILIALVIVGMVKAFFIVKSKVAEKIFDWFGRRTDRFLKGLAVIYISIGIAILYFNK